MRLNTTKSTKLARRVKQEFGTWQAVRESSRREDGVYVIQRKGERSDRPRNKMKAATA
jgi:hypothetical protein